MKKKTLLTILAITILLILGPTFYFRVIKPRLTKAAWFNDSWAYRTVITITNSGSAVTNQKVKLDIDTATLYTAGKIQVNCNDSRFTDANGKLLQYYLDSTNGACNTSSTDYYVLLPTIYAGSTTIYHYYGNPSAAKGSVASQFSQATFSQSSTTTATEEKSKAPVAYWSFDEGQGTKVNDSSTSRNAGSLGTGTSAPAWQTEDMCVAGKCLKFDGSNDYASISNSSKFNFVNSDFTASFWFKANSWGSYATLIDFETAGWNGWLVRYSTATGGITLGGSGSERNALNTIPSLNQWHHLVITYSESTTSLKGYLDGVLDKTTSVNLNLTNSTTPHAFGNNYENSTQAFNGFLDEVKIYPYARSAAEIKADFNARGTNKGVSFRTRSGIYNIDSSSAAGMTSGLVGYWKMDENTGTTTADSSGNGNTGTFGTGSSAPSWSTGVYGVGLSFDGNGKYASVTNYNITATSGRTGCAWIKPTAFTNSLAAVFRRTRDFSIRFNTSGKFNDRAANSVGTDSLAYTGNSAVATGQWSHVCVTWESPGPNQNIILKYYINGKLDLNQVTNISDTNGLVGGYSSNNLEIGRDADAAGRFFNGLIDEVRLYNRTLSPAEVRNLYNWAPGPVAYYNFNEGVGSSAYDTSGYGNNGVWSGTGTHWATGKFGKAGKFNGTNDGVQVNSAPNLTGSDTLSAWVYPTSTANYNMIFDSQWPAGTGNNQYSIFLDSNRKFERYSSGGCISNTALTLNKWSYVVSTYDGTNINLYINGILDKQCALAKPSTTTTVLRLGMRDTSNNVFNGLLDEVKIYNYARTQKQIIEDMNAGHPAGGSPLGSMIAKYSFDEGYGTTIRNEGYGGSSLNGTLGTGSSAPSWSNDGKFGKALSFDGSGDYAYTANTAMMAGAGQTYPSAAFSAWVYPQTSAASKTIIHKNTEFRMTTDSNSKVNCNIYAGGAWQTAAISSSALSLNTWGHILCNYDGTNIKVWENGVNKGNQAETDQILSLSSTALFVARDSTTATGTFQGLIDDIKIYNYSLSQDEILVDYNQGASLVLGSLSTGSSNPASSNAGSQEYCVPGDTTTNCSPPVGRWDFNEGMGTSAYDTSGNGNNGVLGTGNSAPTWATGKVGKALRFDGTNNKLVNMGDPSNGSLDFGSGNFSVSMWFKTGATGTRWLISKHVVSAQLYGIDIGRTNGNLKGWIRDGSLNLISPATTGNYNDNKWHHVVLVRNGSTGYLYVDGGKEIASNTNTSTGSISNSASLWVGRLTDYTGGLELFDGLIDQVRIYNYARTPSQIAWDYNQGAPVAYYDFDACQGTTLSSLNTSFDSSLNATLSIGSTGTQGTVGTCTVGTGSTAAWGNGSVGKYNASLNFDGTDDYAVTANVALLVGAGQSAPSLSWGAWVYPTTSVASKTIINKNNEFKLETDANSKANCSIYKAGSWQTAATGSTSLTTNSWSHVLCVYDGTNITVWINGENKGNQGTTGSILSLSSTALSIARDPTPSQYFSGQIDDVKVWNYPLTAVQVKTEYNQGGAVRFGPESGSP